ncbi:hypothetical protein ACHAAC_06705 [Aeromicrobium sp. CF4.19]|uniref:hypothetical protein n=1 Tax=Aeromicrobium sp. CF4.19 TaxID=3373082 RepID=UPI003EE4E1B6
MRETYRQLEGWQRRAAKADPEQPQSGSEFDSDDQVFPKYPISELARQSLVTAGEHLRLSRDAIESGNLYPSAHFTALRGALVGASQAVWIMAPDDRDSRVQRGLKALAEMYMQMHKYYGALEGVRLDASQKVELAEQLGWVAEREAQVAALRRTQESLNVTDMITAALQFTFEDRAKREAGFLLWKQMGSDAHALGWSVAQRHHSVAPDRNSGLAVIAIRGNASQIAQPFICSFELLRRGWSLFDQRCEAP